MRAEESAGDLLANGAEAMIEAAFRTGEYADAETMLQVARVRARAAWSSSGTPATPRSSRAVTAT
jgi:hypothetical protein